MKRTRTKFSRLKWDIHLERWFLNESKRRLRKPRPSRQQGTQDNGAQDEAERTAILATRSNGLHPKSDGLQPSGFLLLLEHSLSGSS